MTPFAAAVGYKIGPLAAAGGGAIAAALSGAEITTILVASVTAAGAAFAKIAESRSRITADEVKALRDKASSIDGLEARARAAESTVHEQSLGIKDLVHQLERADLEPVWLPPDE